MVTQKSPKKAAAVCRPHQVADLCAQCGKGTPYQLWLVDHRESGYPLTLPVH
jgi:hypothetical protein